MSTNQDRVIKLLSSDEPNGHSKWRGLDSMRKELHVGSRQIRYAVDDLVHRGVLLKNIKASGTYYGLSAKGLRIAEEMRGGERINPLTITLSTLGSALWNESRMLA